MKKIILYASLLSLVMLVMTVLISGGRSVHTMLDYGFMWEQDHIEESLPLGDNLVSGAEIAVNGQPGDKALLRAVNDGSISFRWDSPKTFNTLILKEPGSTVLAFDVQAAEGSEWRTVYSSDQIGRFRYILLNDPETAEPLTADGIRIRVHSANGFIGNRFKIEDFGLYLVDRKVRDDFMVTAYTTAASNYESTLAMLEHEDFSVVNDFLIYGGISMDAQGHLVESDGFAPVYNEILRKSSLSGKEVSLRISIFAAPTEGMSGFEVYQSGFRMGRENTVADMKKILSRYPALGGVDYDWEGVIPPEGWEDYSAIFTDLHQAYPDLKLSLASQTVPDFALSPEALNVLDTVHIMGYDNYDENWYHANFETTGYGMVNRTLDYGFTRDQTVLGVPFYGRPDIDSWDVAQWRNHNEFSGELGWYGNLIAVEDIVQGKQFSYDLYFNSPAMIADKTAFAIDSGIRGVMIWEYRLTEAKEDPNSLFRAIELALKSRGGL